MRTNLNVQTGKAEKVEESVRKIIRITLKPTICGAIYLRCSYSAVWSKVIAKFNNIDFFQIY